MPESGTYEIVFDRDYVEAVLSKHASKGLLELRPERLKYHPFLVSRTGPLKPGAADAAIAALAGAAVDGDGVADAAPAAVDDDEANPVDPVQDVILHGEDPETLALVAALAHEESPKRSLRKRNSVSEEVAEGGTPKPKRARRSTRPAPVVDLSGLQRRASRRQIPPAEEAAPAVAVPVSEAETAIVAPASAEEAEVEMVEVQDGDEATLVAKREQLDGMEAQEKVLEEATEKEGNEKEKEVEVIQVDDGEADAEGEEEDADAEGEIDEDYVQ